MKRRTSLALNTFPPFVLVRFFWREMGGALRTERLKASRQRDERRLAPSNIPPSRKWVVMNPYFPIISWALGAEHPFPSARRECQAALAVPMGMGSQSLLVSGAAAGRPAWILQAVSLRVFQPWEGTCGLPPQSGLRAGKWPSHGEWSFSSFFFFKIFFFLIVDPVLKSLLNLLQYCFCFMFWFFDLLACGVLAPPPGIKPAPPAVEGEVLIPRLPGKYQASVL